MSKLSVVRELNFDCLVGPTHFFGGLSSGNLASQSNKRALSNPKQAALQGLEKMRYLAQRGFLQAVLPPHDRPDCATLKNLGFYGLPHEMLAQAHQHIPDILPKLCSSSAMWAANAATVCPRSDSGDNKTHITPANLVTMFHRSIEPAFTTKLFKNIFCDQELFTIHEALPAHDIFSDEGAANHNRLCPSHDAKGLHIFVHGKADSMRHEPTRLFPARQSLLANEALARNFLLNQDFIIHAQQNPRAIDAGAFHNDVVCVANEYILLCHEQAFLEQEKILQNIQEKYKILYNNNINIIIISQDMLPIEQAVSSYLFNSQILSKNNNSMLLFAPRESELNTHAQAVIKNILNGDNPVDEVAFFDVSESMANGGGPACLRLRVVLSEPELKALNTKIFMSDKLYQDLTKIIHNYYTDNLILENFFDKNFLDASKHALDEISCALGLKNLYAWQTN